MQERLSCCGQLGRRNSCDFSGMHGTTGCLETGEELASIRCCLSWGRGRSRGFPLPGRCRLVTVGGQSEFYGSPNGKFALTSSDQGRCGAVTYIDNIEGPKGLRR